MTNQTSKGGATPPPSRRDRREAARRDRRLTGARTAAQRPAWQSPMVLVSALAVVAGLAIILLAASGLTGRNGAGTGDLLVPIRPAPPELTDPADPAALAVGNPPLTIEVWSDFQCPACGYFARQVEPELIDEFVKDGTVRLVYRDFAFLDTPSGSEPRRNGESHQAALAARCAGAQGKFWRFHDYLYENQDDENAGAFRRERLDLIASTIGLDMGAFGACMSDGTILDEIIAESNAGRAAGVGSTPTLAVNGVLQKPGALGIADLRTIIANALGTASPAPSPSVTPAP